MSISKWCVCKKNGFLKIILITSEKPYVTIHSPRESYFHLNETYMLNCSASGNPVPDMSLKSRSCSGFDDVQNQCSESFDELQVRFFQSFFQNTIAYTDTNRACCVFTV